jgi:outer membrane lipoprotein-sorting protein
MNPAAWGVLAALVLSAAAGDEAAKVFEKMKANFDKSADYTVRVETTAKMQGPEGEVKAVTTVRLTGKGEKKLGEITGVDARGRKMDQLSVFDGVTTWEYDRVKKTARKTEREGLAAGGEPGGGKEFAWAAPLSLAVLERLHYRLEEKMRDGKRCLVLVANAPPMEGPQTIDRLELWVDAESHLPVALETESTMSIPTQEGSPPMRLVTSGVQEFRDWKFNTGVSDGLFDFSPPAGVEVIDQSQGMRTLTEYAAKSRDTKQKKTTAEGAASAQEAAGKK